VSTAQIEDVSYTVVRYRFNHLIFNFTFTFTLMFIRVVLEVGNRTKTHAADLARKVDILPDDIRNFLQRWIIVQVRGV
jgi:hypothetical protein